MIRTPEALIPYMLLLAAVAGGTLWHLGDAERPAQIQLAKLGGPFSLTDQAGRRVTDGEFRGRYVLLYFGYSFCPDVCPTTLASISDALAKLGPKRARVVPVFVTIDPARDTPQVLGTYLKAFGPEFVGLSGSPAEIARIAGEYRVYYQKRHLPGGYAMDHSGEVYLLGPDGVLATFYDPPFDSKALAEDLRRRIG